jgi:hypothetical protein
MSREPDTSKHHSHPPFISRNHLRKRDFFRTHHLHSLGFGGVVSSDALAYLRSSWLPGTGSRQGQPTARPAQATRWLGRLIQFQLVDRPVEEDRLSIRLIPRVVSDRQVGVRPLLAQALPGKPTAREGAVVHRSAGSNCSTVDTQNHRVFMLCLPQLPCWQRAGS